MVLRYNFVGCVRWAEKYKRTTAKIFFFFGFLLGFKSGFCWCLEDRWWLLTFFFFFFGCERSGNEVGL